MINTKYETYCTKTPRIDPFSYPKAISCAISFTLPCGKLLTGGSDYLKQER